MNNHDPYQGLSGTQRRRVEAHDKIIAEKRKRGELRQFGGGINPFTPHTYPKKTKPFITPGGSLLPNKYLFWETYGIED